MPVRHGLNSASADSLTRKGAVMTTRTRLHRRFPERFLPVLFALSLALLIVGCAQTAPGEAFGPPEAGRRIYDRSGTLTTGEVRALEERAEWVAEAGAPVIVYLRVRDADYDDTERDARELMAAWDVQSAPDARDGVVIFLNLKPGDTRHGQVALYAGQHHYQGGNLPERELRRIFEEEIRPPLASGQIAVGIGAGLDALASSLVYGPPPPAPLSPTRKAVGDFARLPLNLLAVAAAIGAAWLARRVWLTRPARVVPGLPTTVRPGDLSPALAGALATGRLQVVPLAEATLLDLARRGALVIESLGRRSVRVRPLNASVVATPYEQRVWATLASVADADGTVPGRALRRLQVRWRPFAATLRADLVARGWYDPAAGARRRPLYLAGSGGLAAATLSAIAAGIGQEGWGLLAAGLFLALGVTLSILGFVYPDTSERGERIAAPWRAYRAGLKRAARQADPALDLDAALPDAVAFGMAASLNRHLKAASGAGYVPSWFARRAAGGPGGFYPVWVVFHGSVGSSAGGGSGGGAAAGGGGAGGSF